MFLMWDNSNISFTCTPITSPYEFGVRHPIPFKDKENGTLHVFDTPHNIVKEASKYIFLERLTLNSQCGFASTEEADI